MSARPNNEPNILAQPERIHQVERQLENHYRAHLAELQGYATALTGDPGAAEDIVQQAFENTLATVRRGVEIDELSHWLYRLIHNLAVDHVRGGQKCPTDALVEDSFPDDLYTDTGSEPIEQVHLHRRYAEVNKALDHLPKGQRTAFLLTEVRGLSYDETASVMGTSIGSVRQFLFRARKTIRTRLEPDNMPLLGTLLALRLNANDSYRPGCRERVKAATVARNCDLHDWVTSITLRLRDLLAQPAAALFAAAMIAAPLLLSGGPPMHEGPSPSKGSVISSTAVHTSTPGGTSSGSEGDRRGAGKRSRGGAAPSRDTPPPLAGHNPERSSGHQQGKSDDTGNGGRRDGPVSEGIDDLLDPGTENGSTLSPENEDPLAQGAGTGSEQVESEPAEQLTPVGELAVEPDPTLGEPDATMGEPDAAMGEPDATIDKYRVLPPGSTPPGSGRHPHAPAKPGGSPDDGTMTDDEAQPDDRSQSAPSDRSQSADGQRDDEPLDSGKVDEEPLF